MRRGGRLGAEDGIALTVAICSLALMITLAAVALQQAVSALRHSSHQTNVKRALQAADAAIDAATYSVARADIGSTLKIDPLNPGSIASQNCVIAGSLGGIDLATLDPVTPTDPAGNRWCPASTPEATTDNATFSYRMSQLLRSGAGPCGTGSALNLDREVVGTGTAGEVTRRVKARLQASIALLSGAAVQSSSTTSNLTMAGTARVLGDVHSNAAITGTLTNVIAGNAVPGSGKTVSAPGPVVSGSKTAACQAFAIPDVEPGSTSTTNDNTLRTDGCVLVATLLSVPCTVFPLPATGGVQYTPATRTLRVWGNGRAVLTGSTYNFCTVRLENQGILQVRSTTPVTRLFIDNPANCAGATNPGTITMDGQARIVNCHAQTAPQSLQVYAVGSTTTPTTQTFASGALLTGALRTTLCGLNLPVIGEAMTIVAPRSTIELGGSTALAGQVAGQVVHLSNAAAVNPINALVNLNQLGSNPVLPLYRPSDYVECSGKAFDDLPPEDPAQGC